MVLFQKCQGHPLIYACYHRIASKEPTSSSTKRPYAVQHFEICRSQQIYIQMDDFLINSWLYPFTMRIINNEKILFRMEKTYIFLMLHSLQEAFPCQILNKFFRPM